MVKRLTLTFSIDADEEIKERWPSRADDKYFGIRRNLIVSHQQSPSDKLTLKQVSLKNAKMVASQNTTSHTPGIDDGAYTCNKTTNGTLVEAILFLLDPTSRTSI
jgi:hypothetical protein